MFNIRAYGIIVHDSQILLSHEFIHQKELTKFPGGGLQFGEGLADCLKREFMEEYGLRVNVGKCVYVTDFFVASLFNSSQQVISIYFETIIETGQAIPHEKIENDNGPAEWHRLEWHALKELNEPDFYFPIDKKVLAIIKEKYLS